MGDEESDDDTTPSAHLLPRSGDSSDYNERLRVKTSDEIVDSEKKYLGQLGLLFEYFVEPLSHGKILAASESSAIFSNVAQIKVVSETLLFELQQAGVAEAFVSLCPFLKQYALYASNYQRAMSTLTALSQKQGPFLEFMRIQECRPELQGLKLISLLIMPVQRVPRYKLLLERLLKYSNPEGAAGGDIKKLQDAVRQVAEVADYVNQQVSVYANMHRAVEIQRSLSAAGDGHAIELLKPWRALLKEGVLRKMSSKAGRPSQRAVFLFTDIFMYARIERGGSYSHVVLLELKHLYASRGAVAASAATATAAAGGRKWTPGGGGGSSSSWWKDNQLQSRVLQITCKEKKIALVAQRETEAIAWFDAIQNAVSQCRQCVRSHRRARPSSAHAALASAARCVAGSPTLVALGSADVTEEAATHSLAAAEGCSDGSPALDSGTPPQPAASVRASASDHSLIMSVDVRATPKCLAQSPSSTAGSADAPRAAPRRRRQMQDVSASHLPNLSSEAVQRNSAVCANETAGAAANLRNNDSGCSTPNSGRCKSTSQHSDVAPSRSADVATDAQTTGTGQPRVSKWRKRCDILVRAGQLLTQVVTTSPLLPAPKPPVFSPVLGD